MSDPSAEGTGTIKGREILARWPFSMGAGVNFANIVAVNTTPSGYVLEFGTVLVTGLINRGPTEIEHLLKEVAEVNVVSRVLLPPDVAIQLHRFLSKRLTEDGRLPVAPGGAS